MEETPGFLLGQAVRELRESRGWSLQRLADLSAASKSYLHKLETGKIEHPTSYMISKLAKALGVAETDLLKATLGHATEGLSWPERSFLVRFVEASPEMRQAVMEIAESAFIALDRYDQQDKTPPLSWEEKIQYTMELVRQRPSATEETLMRRVYSLKRDEAKLLLRMAKKRLRASG